MRSGSVRTVESEHLCQLCGNRLSPSKNNSLIIRDVPDSTFNISSKTITLHIADCKSCGLIQLIDVPLSSDYEVVNRSIGISTGYREEKIRQLESFIRRKKLYTAKVLEVGCGNGQYLEILEGLGLKNLTGLESGETNSQACLEKGFSVIHGSLLSSLWDKGTVRLFDAFFMFHFLEHMPDPVKFIRRLYKIIKSGGVGLIEVPNYDHIEKNNIWLEFTKDHRFYYRKRTLCHLLITGGFNVELLEENNSGICLTAVVSKPNIKNPDFSSLKRQMKKDILGFKDMIDGLKGPFAVYGAGHYSQLLLNAVRRQFGIKPKHVFDSNKQKWGQSLGGIVIEPGEQAAIMGDCNTIVVICGVYNDEVCQTLLHSGKKVLKWR